MPTGRGFTDSERFEIDRAIRAAELRSHVEFSVYAGPFEGDPRAYVTRLHGALVAPARSVLIALDVARHSLQVVTGAEVRRVLTDQEVTLAVAQMQSAFGHGDFVGGLKQGLHMLAEHATRPATLHA